MEISPEQLAETGGVVVCPQCLSSVKVATVAQRRKSSPQPAPPAEVPPVKQVRSQKVISFEPPATPPPHRKRTMTTPPPRTAPTPPPKPRPQTITKKMNTKNNNTAESNKGMLHTIANPPSPLGCLWRSIVATAVLLLVYIFFGFVFSL